MKKTHLILLTVLLNIINFSCTPTSIPNNTGELIACCSDGGDIPPEDEGEEEEEEE